MTPQRLRASPSKQRALLACPERSRRAGDGPRNSSQLLALSFWLSAFCNWQLGIGIRELVLTVGSPWKSGHSWPRQVAFQNLVGFSPRAPKGEILKMRL